MNLDNFNFDALIKETLELSKSVENREFNLPKDDFELNFNDENFENSLVTEEEIQVFPETPGLIYRIQKGGSTFSLRGIAVENISEAMDEIESNDQRLMDDFKISPEEFNSSSLNFFSLDFIEQAEVIKDEIFNRRFPLKEDVLCNISDPGYSWWMDDYGSGFSIYFKSHGIERDSDLLKLGPIGDSKIASFRFKGLPEKLKHFLDIANFECSDRGLEVECSGNNPTLSMLKNIFSKGELPKNWLNSLQKIDRTLYYFLWEIATMRKFWVEIERKLED